MSSLTSLYGGGGGGTPVNSIAQLWVGGQTQYTDADGGVWIKTGNTITANITNYPDAYVRTADITGSTYIQSFSLSGQTGNPQSVTFNNNGTKMYVIGFSEQRVFQYSLSTAYDLSSASYSGTSLSIGAQELQPRGIAFSGDGTKMYICGTSGDDVSEYALTTAFDISTASYTTAFVVASQDLSPFSLQFNNDGTKMFVLGNASDSVYEYSLSTAYSVSTASYSGNSFATTSQDQTPLGFAFSDDGKRIFILGDQFDRVYEYALNTAFDLSNVSYTGASFSVQTQDTAPYEICFSNDFSKMFVVGQQNDDVYEYSVPSTMGLNVDTGTYDYVKLK